MSNTRLYLAAFLITACVLILFVIPHGGHWTISSSGSGEDGSGYVVSKRSANDIDAGDLGGGQGGGGGGYAEYDTKGRLDGNPIDLALNNDMKDEAENNERFHKPNKDRKAEFREKIDPIDDDERHDPAEKNKDNGKHDDEQHSSHSSFHRTSRFDVTLADSKHPLALKQPLLPAKIMRLYSGSVMPLLVPPESAYKMKGIQLLQRHHTAGKDNKHQHQKSVVEEDADAGGGTSDAAVQKMWSERLKQREPMFGEKILQETCPTWGVAESPSNVAFAIAFSRILRERFPPERGGALDGSGLHWMLDEGGLIGSSRAGALRNADDDFDFFLLLPNQHAPCRPDSLTCTPEEYNAMIHRFLMVFHEEGMCINKFSPDPKRFKSRGRLMFSFQLNRGSAADPERCFQESKPFAHMHLGIFNERGEVCTNVWIPSHSTHIKDRLHLDDMLPVARCRAGPVDVPCPQNITGFLTVRNGGEYRKRSADGSCLIMKKKWGLKRKQSQAKTLQELDKCGYNSIVDLLPEFLASNYKNC